ncbi:unnamed protein product [Polarella glacialis]|uniref:C3H1-type domain-containing protein n=1 Tax=Polarella glacialis TaxID=89957 RepID=A0A813DYZ4_POLGL|nr:unnamed protein product [Polarella glacialis]
MWGLGGFGGCKGGGCGFGPYGGMGGMGCKGGFGLGGFGGCKGGGHLPGCICAVCQASGCKGGKGGCGGCGGFGGCGGGCGHLPGCICPACQMAGGAAGGKAGGCGHLPGCICPACNVGNANAGVAACSAGNANAPIPCGAGNGFGCSGGGAGVGGGKAAVSHLPGCICPACRAANPGNDGKGGLVSDGRGGIVALGAGNGDGKGFGKGGGGPAVSPAKQALDAESLNAYKEMQATMQEPAPVKEEPLPVGPLNMAEVQNFAFRFNLDPKLQERVVNALTRRRDKWVLDLKDLNRALSTARNPPGILCVKLNDLEKLCDAEDARLGVKTAPTILCFNYRAGTCTYGAKCKYSHDIATGLQRATSSTLLEQGAQGTIAALPSYGPPLQGGSTGGGAGGFTGGGGSLSISDAPKEPAGGDGSGFDGRKKREEKRRKRSPSRSRSGGRRPERPRSRSGRDERGATDRSPSRRQRRRWD